MTSHKAIVSGISGRYAIALFELAVDGKALPTVEADLASLRAMIADSDDLNALVTSPIYSSEQQLAGINAVANAAKLSPLTVKFLGVLATNRRLSSLSGVIRAFEQLVADHRGEVSATVVSAKALTKAQEASLAKNLKAAIGSDVTIDAAVDEDLIGGLKVQVGSQMIDSSLKTKLDNLAISMKGVQ